MAAVGFDVGLLDADKQAVVPLLGQCGYDGRDAKANNPEVAPCTM